MKTWRYLRELYRLSLEATKQELGTKGAALILALKIFGAAFGIALFVTMGLLKDNEPIYKIVFAIFISDIVGFVVLFIASPIIAIFRIPKVAFERDADKSKKISELEIALQRKSLALIVGPGSNISVDVGGGIPRVTLTIDVINNEPRKIVDLEAYLISADQMREEFPDDWSFTNSFTFRTHRLEWKDKKYVVDLPPGLPESFVRIVSLDCSNSEVMFIHEGQMRRIPDLRCDALYRIRIEFKGKLEGENPDYRFCYYETVFVCAPNNCQIGFLSTEKGNPNLPDWLRRRIQLEIDKIPKESS